MSMPNVISDLANQYAYKREVSSTESKADTSVPMPDIARNEPGRVQPAIDRSELENKVENLNHMVDRNLEFSVDEETGQQVIRVVDSDTGKVLRQIPPDQILHIISQVQKASEGMLPGVLLDDEV
jgi:flagellar protein FlaG